MRNLFSLAFLWVQRSVRCFRLLAIKRQGIFAADHGMVPFQLSYSTHSVHDGSYAIQGCRGCQQQNLVGETKMLSCGPTSRTTYRDVTIRLTPRKSRMPIERKLGYGFVLKRRRASGGTRELQEMQLRKLSSTKTTERKLFSSLLVWWVAVNGKKWQTRRNYQSGNVSCA